MKAKFKIGDDVVFSVTTKRKRFKWFYLREAKKEIHDAEPSLFRVTDVNIETCYGGIQVHYNLRGTNITRSGFLQGDHSSASVTENLIRAREMELELA